MKDTRKKSRDLKILSGNAGKRPIKDEPQFKNDKMLPPDFLDEIALGEWNRVAPELIASGVLTNLDTAILAGYCCQCSIAVQASKKIWEQSLLIKRTPKSKILTPNPYLPIQREALKLMKSFAKELGITPASRSRVSANPVKDDPYKKIKELREARITDIKEKREQSKSLAVAKAKAIKKAIKNTAAKKTKSKKTATKKATAKKSDGKAARIASMKAKIKEAAKAKTENKKNPNDRPTAG